MKLTSVYGPYLKQGAAQIILLASVYRANIGALRREVTLPKVTQLLKAEPGFAPRLGLIPEAELFIAVRATTVTAVGNCRQEPVLGGTVDWRACRFQKCAL